MEPIDIAAHITALNQLVRDLESCGTVKDRLILYTAIRSLIRDLEQEAEDSAGSVNIKGILTEIKSHTRAMAGLYPSYQMSEEKHFHFALSSVSKLPMPTAFNV